MDDPILEEAAPTTTTTRTAAAASASAASAVAFVRQKHPGIEAGLQRHDQLASQAAGR